MKKYNLSVDQIIDAIKKWLVTGELNTDILADDFEFSSPFWKKANRLEFIKQFGDPTSYQEAVLSKITHFDPVIILKDTNEKYFTIVLQYHTKYGRHVYETVFGVIENGLLIELRSIYDLDETKHALQLD